MNKILNRAALAAVLFLPALLLTGCDDPAVQDRVNACMANLISAGKVNTVTKSYYEQVCYQQVTQGH